MEAVTTVPFLFTQCCMCVLVRLARKGENPAVWFTETIWALGRPLFSSTTGKFQNASYPHLLAIERVS